MPGKNHNPVFFNWNPKTIEEAMHQICSSIPTEEFDIYGKRDAHKIVALYPEGKILDFGCGIGRILKHLPPERTVGYEPNPICKFAYQWLQNTNCIVIESLDTFSKYFDVVIDSLVLQHIEEPEWTKVIALIHRVLKNDGVLLRRIGNTNTDNMNIEGFSRTKTDEQFIIYKLAS